MKPHRHPVLADRKETVRQSIQRELEIGPTTAQELSKLVSIREKEVANHLEHLAKSAKHDNKRLEILPAVCLSCNFVFKERSRFTRPSACPRCRMSRIEPPQFSLVADR